ncbi:MAG: hypothetical protein HYZ87_00655, partial [Candidatus Omnitrophica bacterium]|nr:hypothetical protein [Candidatus Omnitrophota bacterium]
MKSFKGLVFMGMAALMMLTWTLSEAAGQDYSSSGSSEDYNKKVLKQGLLGAGTGAIAAGASGGKAGQGALIGAGTNVIGGALLDTITTPSQQPQYQPQQVQYVQQAPQYSQAGYPVQAQGAYVEPPQPVVYAPRTQEDPTKKILKQGLLGAGTGAIAASASGGKAGKGALIGAGTNIIGGALLDTLTGSSQP